MADFVSKEEFEELKGEVRELTKSVNTFVDHSSRYIDVLLASVTGQVPERSIPIESHNRVVRYIITAFSLMMVVALGTTKLLPYFFDKQ